VKKANGHPSKTKRRAPSRGGGSYWDLGQAVRGMRRMKKVGQNIKKEKLRDCWEETSPLQKKKETC